MATTTRKKPSLASFKRWLAAQPSDREFDFFDNENCLIASFMTETDVHGNKWECPGYNEATCGGVSLRVPKIIDRVAMSIARWFTVADFRKELAKHERN